MNRTFLIFLMIGTALMIMVMGDGNQQARHNASPWQIYVHENGNVRVFGITLGKNTIQDANQILASFPQSRFMNDSDQPRLLAIYDELNIGGFIATIELEYQLDREDLNKISSQVSFQEGTHYALLDKDLEMSLLSTVIQKLTYRPSIDYDMDEILQRFGPPSDEQQLSTTLSQLNYPGLGLQILIDSQGPETFSYGLVSPDTKPGHNANDQS